MLLGNKPIVALPRVAHRSLGTALFFEAFSLLAITVILMGIAAFFLAKHELRVHMISGLQSAVYARENVLEMTIARERAQVSILAHDPSLTRLPSITHLIGFQELRRIDLHQRETSLTGQSRTIILPPSVLRDSARADHTTFQPIFSDLGWILYVLTAPELNVKGERVGTLLAIFDPKELMARLFETEFVGSSAEVLLATVQDNNLTILHADGQGHAVPIRTENEKQTRLIERALRGEQGVEETTDYAGIPVLSAYRTMPSIGWTVIINMDAYELTAPILRLAMDLVGIGLMLVCLLSLSMFFLATRIIGPLEELVRKLNGLETHRWRFRRSIFTGNELESVDSAAADLTRRLRESYDHLEDIVRSRTQALYEQNAQDAAILENVEYGLLMTNEHGCIVYMNHAGELLTGRTSRDIVGKDIRDVLCILDKANETLPPDTHPVRCVLTRKERFSPLTDPEYSLLRTDGTKTALHIRVTPILKGKECLGTVAVFRDTTEERRISHVKSDFIALVSHQLRTPLSSMRWYLEMLLGQDAGPLNPNQRDYVEEVATSNARMVHLVNALLNVSRLELGNMHVNTEIVSLQKLLTDIADSFKLELKRRKIELQIEMEAGPTPEIRSDRGLLQLLIENLISNAVKYGEEGVPVKVGIVYDQRKSIATITVTNQGIGIPENQQDQIFQKMFRGTNAKASDTDGNGLGLYISHVAAETIGATLRFESSEGVGATFIVELPLERDGLSTENTR